MRLVIALVASLAALASTGPLAAAPPLDPAPVLAEARAARARGDMEHAIELLKQAMEDLPESEDVVLALAAAYLADDNPTWATRVLSRHLEYHPDACNTRFLLALVQMMAGMSDVASDLLEDAACDAPAEVRARGELLRAQLALLEENGHDARLWLGRARASGRMYEEDWALAAALNRELEPDRLPVVSGRAELGSGWTSNGLAGSPVDLANPETAPSGLTQLDVRARLVSPGPIPFRPALEGQLRVQELWAAEAHDLSFSTATLRAGVLIGRRSPMALVAFAADATRLEGGDRYSDGSTWFSEAQRGELELELNHATALFAGVGRRRFRELGRTRTEADVALGWALPGPRGSRLIGGASVRAHEAANDAYDLLGASVVLQGWVPITRGVELSATYALNADAYLRSGGYFQGSSGVDRRDAQLRFEGGLWSPRFAHLRAGVTYEHQRRVSTAEAYDYADQRWLARLEWRFDSDVTGRRLVRRKHRTRFEYRALGVNGAHELGQVRDLMRQDDAAQRGASCLR